MTIKDLGRWESLEMVQRYTQPVTSHNSSKFYKAPLSQNYTWMQALSHAFKLTTSLWSIQTIFWIVKLQATAGACSMNPIGGINRISFLS